MFNWLYRYIADNYIKISVNEKCMFIVCFHLYSIQALLELGELFPAVQSAEKAVTLDPSWAIARQSLGRAQLGLGELNMVFVQSVYPHCHLILGLVLFLILINISSLYVSYRIHLWT